jgi:hypothetical protein
MLVHPLFLAARTASCAANNEASVCVGLKCLQIRKQQKHTGETGQNTTNEKEKTPPPKHHRHHHHKRRTHSSLIEPSVRTISGGLKSKRMQRAHSCLSASVRI